MKFELLEKFEQFKKKEIEKFQEILIFIILMRLLTLALKEFGKYRVLQDQIFESDFDKEIKKITGQ